ncbi:hypothetical protein M3O96_11110 [Aquiflexum sp. TKW24L]|uniref:hypothetical protein n=1 Tax=Aquiflexum sp. TKW24L TaxID=2942212 RepID=UPI0020C0AEBF|nr:hypothetical protein [Aquiflexum sp. TKW24L]MCL6259643.1 hypothetical protein [Aquiflexum sp. TKW24L]
MANFLNKYFPIEFRIFFRGFLIVALIILIFPLGSLLMWHLTPPGPLEVVVIDKTVPNQKHQEHQSIHWLLNHFRYTKSDGSIYDETLDYFGFFPGEERDQYQINDLSNQTESKKQEILNETKVIYFADTYGVYDNDLTDKPAQTYSKKIYGGMDSLDMSFLEKAYKAEIDIISEFNTIASPTKKDVRMDFENLVGIKWTGWIARYFDELDTLLNEELPPWLVAGYMRQHNSAWDFSGSAMVFLHENGQIEILRDKVEIKNTVPHIVSGLNSQQTYGIPEIVKYPYWIDIILVSRDYEVISHYDLAPTEAGIKKLSELGLPKYFPAVVVKKNGAGKFYYFCGDFADNPVSGFSNKFFGIEKIWRMFLHSEDYSQRNSFFWNYYYPLMGTILKDTYQRKDITRTRD